MSMDMYRQQLRKDRKKGIIISALIGFSILLLVLVYFWPTYDYDSKQFYNALEANEDVSGKIVRFEVMDMEENPMLGNTMIDSNGVYYVNGTNNEIKVGDTVEIRVKEFGNAFGSWIITYTKP